MNGVENLQPVPAPIAACTVSRDLRNFDLLINEMERELGESWGDLSFDDALAFLGRPEAEMLEFLAVALDAQDQGDPGRIRDVMQAAAARAIRVILIADRISPVAIQQIRMWGAEDVVPYPLPEGALHEAIERIRAPSPPAPAGLGGAPALSSMSLPGGGMGTTVAEELLPPLGGVGGRRGVILAVHGLAGGVGASNFAINLAWELATICGPRARVCLLDLDFQFGSIATYLDLPREDAVAALLTEIEHAGHFQMLQAMQVFNERLHVLTAPPRMLPLEVISSEGMDRLVEMARAEFDFMVIDMPRTITAWTISILSQAHSYFALLQLDLRSAQNLLRLVNAIKAEGLPEEKLRYVLNRAPGFADLAAKARVRRMAESLGVDIDLQLPEGGGQMTQANDNGLPLSEGFARNPWRREVEKLARTLVELHSQAEFG